jgi:KDO2-lipid IV(A) lauroyltransferase
MSLKTSILNLLMQRMSRIPLSTLHKWGNGLGYLASVIPNRVRSVATINIARCFPELSNRQQKSLRRRCLQEISKAIFELPAIWQLPLEKLSPWIVKVSGEQQFQQALNQGRGVILLGAHMGAEELLNAYISPKYPGTWIYRPQKGYMDKLIHQARERFGSKFVPTDALGVKALYKNLLDRRVTGMSCDHNAPSRSGVYAPFFGISTWTMTLATRFAQKTKAPVFLVHMQRLENAQGFHMHFIQVSDDIYHQDEVIAATAMNKTLEDCIRDHPEQYHWGYKRFRRRPPHEPKFYE